MHFQKVEHFQQNLQSSTWLLWQKSLEAITKKSSAEKRQLKKNSPHCTGVETMKEHSVSNIQMNKQSALNLQ